MSYFLARLAATPAPPCVECDNSLKCKEERLACFEFYDYISTASENPRKASGSNRYYYLLIYPTEKTPGLKACSICGEERSLDLYGPSARETSERARPSECRMCRAEKNSSKTFPKEKECSVCIKVRPIAEFHKNGCAKDGRSSQCKECRKQKRALVKAEACKARQSN